MARGHADSPSADELAKAAREPSFHGGEPAEGVLASVPPLALLAAVSAVLHVALYRLLSPLLAANKVPMHDLFLVAAPFTLNLAGASGLVALTCSTVDLVRARDLTYTARRVLIAGLAGVLISTLGLSLFMPEGRVSAAQVLLATGALHAMVVQVAMATLQGQRSLAGGTTACLIAAASLFPLVALIARHADLGPMRSWLYAAQEGVASLYGLGELAYLLMPIAAAFVVLPWDDAPSGRFARRAGAVAVCIMAVLFGAAARMPNELFGHILYSSLRLEWALEKASLGYAVPVSLATGAAMAATVSRDTRHRQGGAGLWLWLAGGFNPLTPARLLMAALGACLVCRAVVSLAADRKASAAP